MKKSVVAAILVLGGAAHAQDGGIKPGLWNSKVDHYTVDGQDMSAKMADAQAQMQAAMAKMSPAQRKQMEAMMGNRMAMGSNGNIQICISPAMASHDESWVNQHNKCASGTKVTHTGNKLSFSVNCTENGRTTVGSGESVLNGDSTTTHMDMTVTDARGKHNVVIDSEMSYAGSDCKGIKPADQMAKGK